MLYPSHTVLCLCACVLVKSGKRERAGRGEGWGCEKRKSGKGWVVSLSPIFVPLCPPSYRIAFSRIHLGLYLLQGEVRIDQATDFNMHPKTQLPLLIAHYIIQRECLWDFWLLYHIISTVAWVFVNVLLAITSDSIALPTDNRHHSFFSVILLYI